MAGEKFRRRLLQSYSLDRFDERAVKKPILGSLGKKLPWVHQSTGRLFFHIFEQQFCYPDYQNGLLVSGLCGAVWPIVRHQRRRTAIASQIKSRYVGTHKKLTDFCSLFLWQLQYILAQYTVSTKGGCDLEEECIRYSIQYCIDLKTNLYCLVVILSSL